MNKLQTVYIPVSDLNSSELIVCNEGIENSCLDRVKIVEAFVFTPEELKQLLSDAIEHGLNSFDEFDKGYNYDEESRAEGLKEIQEEYIENFLNKEK
jgi:hypothetical protein